jgi:hypothetical protein
VLNLVGSHTHTSVSDDTTFFQLQQIKINFKILEWNEGEGEKKGYGGDRIKNYVLEWGRILLLTTT